MNEHDNDLAYFDEYPQDDPFEPTETDGLEYKQEVVNRLLDAVDEFLEFGTVRQLIKLLGDNL